MKKRTPIPPVDAAILEKFCSYCAKTYEEWSLVSGLCERPEYIEAMNKSMDGHFFSQVIDILHRHFLLQVAKLHDKTLIAEKVTMSLSYIIANGNWDKITRKKLDTLKGAMGACLGKVVKPARNEILAHNGLDIYIHGGRLGEFPAGKDVEYFEHLQEFVNLIHPRGIYPFGNHSHTDAIGFLNRLARTGILEVPGVSVTLPV